MSEPTKISTLVHKMLNEMLDDAEQRLAELNKKFNEVSGRLADSNITEEDE